MKLGVGLALLLAWAAPAEGQRLPFPPRPAEAPAGAAFAREIADLDPAEREARIVEAILAGNVPSWLRELVPVVVEGRGGQRITLRVTPDYLSVGSDEDWLLLPMRPGSAQRIADTLGASLPTPRLVDAVWAAAEVRLEPSPIPPSDAMTTIPVFVEHAARIRAQRREAGARPGALIAGHKKDVVVSRELVGVSGRVAIYGWHHLDGEPIQPLYLGHTDDWVDYSHGIRLVDRRILVDGEQRDLLDALRDPVLADALSSEGILLRPRYEVEPPDGGSLAIHAPGRQDRSMSTAGLAVFVFVGFLLPVPLLHWLDAPGRGAADQGDG